MCRNIAKEHANHQICCSIQQAYKDEPGVFSMAYCDICKHDCPVDASPVDGSTPYRWRGVPGGIPCIDCSQMNQQSPGDGGSAKPASDIFFSERQRKMAKDSHHCGWSQFFF